MKKFWMMGVSLAAFGLSALPVFAQQTASTTQNRKAGDMPGPIDSIEDLQDTGRMIFKLADENNDGQISQKEAGDAGNLVVGGFFFRADQNGDGVLSADEAKQARESFLATKPWLRYAIETAQAKGAQNRGAQGGQAGQPANANSGTTNPLAAVTAALDSNNDKQIQASELRQAVQSGIQGLFATADTNRDGQLSTIEVNAGMASATQTVGQAVFQQADTDGNGTISQGEFEKALVEPSRTAFAILDLNHDGQLSQQEAQTVRQVLVSKVKMLNMPEASNSPRNQANSALSSPRQPTQIPAAPPSSTPPAGAPR